MNRLALNSCVNLRFILVNPFFVNQKEKITNMDWIENRLFKDRDWFLYENFLIWNTPCLCSIDFFIHSFHSISFNFNSIDNVVDDDRTLSTNAIIAFFVNNNKNVLLFDRFSYFSLSLSFHLKPIREDWPWFFTISLFFFLSFFSKIRSLCCFLAKQSEQISDQWSLMIKDKIIIIKSISHHHHQHKAIFICLRLLIQQQPINCLTYGMLPIKHTYRSIFFSECYRYDIWHLFMKGMNYFENFIYLFIVINF